MNIIKQLTTDFPGHIFLIKENKLTVDGIPAIVQYTNGQGKILEEIGLDLLNSAEETLYALLKRDIDLDIKKRTKGPK